MIWPILYVPDLFNHSVRHIGFAILGIENLTTDSESATPKINVRFYRIFFLFFESQSAILNPPFWIFEIWLQIWIQRAQKLVYEQFHRGLNISQNFENLTPNSDSPTPKAYVQPLSPIFVGNSVKRPHTYIFFKFPTEKSPFWKW